MSMRWQWRAVDEEYDRFYDLLEGLSPERAVLEAARKVTELTCMEQYPPYRSYIPQGRHGQRALGLLSMTVMRLDEVEPPRAATLLVQARRALAPEWTAADEVRRQAEYEVWSREQGIEPLPF